ALELLADLLQHGAGAGADRAVALPALRVLAGALLGGLVVGQRAVSERFRGARNIGGPSGSRQRPPRRATGRSGFIPSGHRPIRPPDASVWREQLTRNGPWPARAVRAAVLVSILIAPGGAHGQEASAPSPIRGGQEASAPGPIRGEQEASAPAAD